MTGITNIVLTDKNSLIASGETTYLINIVNKSWTIGAIDDANSAVTFSGASYDIAWLSGGTYWNNVYDMNQSGGTIIVQGGPTGIAPPPNAEPINMIISGSDVIVYYNGENFNLLRNYSIAVGDVLRPNYFFNCDLNHNLGIKYPIVYVYDGDTDKIIYPTTVNSSFLTTGVKSQDTNTLKFLDIGTSTYKSTNYNIIIKR
jgi:hypothetical protein